MRLILKKILPCIKAAQQNTQWTQAPPWVLCGWLLKYLESYDMVQVRPPDELTVIPADEAPVVSGPTVRHFNPATVWP